MILLRWAAVGVVLAGALVAWGSLLEGMARLSLQAVVLPAVGVLGILVRPRDRREIVPGWDGVGTALAVTLAVAVLLHLGWTLTAFALAPVWLFAAAAMVWGWSFAASHAPLWSAAWGALVLSPGVVERLDEWLMTAATWSAVALLRLEGFDARADGHLVLGLAVPIEVTEACAGTTISAGAYILGVVIGSLTLQRSRVRWLVGVAFAGVSFVANLIRIVAVSTVAALLGREAAVAAHDPVGYLMAAVGYAILGFMILRIRKRERACRGGNLEEQTIPPAPAPSQAGA